MQKIRFAELPIIVKITSLATLFIGWVLFEEFIIDRHGLDQYLPFYRVGNLCLYDAAMLAILIPGWFWLHRSRSD